MLQDLDEAHGLGLPIPPRPISRALRRRLERWRHVRAWGSGTLGAGSSCVARWRKSCPRHLPSGSWEYSAWWSSVA